MRMHIIERRRNPEQNTKTLPLERLLAYQGRKDVFVSFTADVGAKSHGANTGANTSGAKIGINPRSTFDTPLGIYCYPAFHVIEISTSIGDISAEFTGNDSWKYLWVIQSKTSKILDYTASDGDLEKAKETLRPLSKDWEFIENSAKTNANNKTPFGLIWYLTKLYADNLATQGKGKSSIIWTFLLRKKLGYDLVVDWKGEKIIHKNEPTQAVFLDPTAFVRLEVIEQDTNSKIVKFINSTPDDQLHRISYDNMPEALILKIFKDAWQVNVASLENNFSKWSPSTQLGVLLNMDRFLRDSLIKRLDFTMGEGMNDAFMSALRSRSSSNVFFFFKIVKELFDRYELKPSTDLYRAMFDKEPELFFKVFKDDAFETDMVEYFMKLVSMDWETMISLITIISRSKIDEDLVRKFATNNYVFILENFEPFIKYIDFTKIDPGSVRGHLINSVPENIKINIILDNPQKFGYLHNPSFRFAMQVMNKLDSIKKKNYLAIEMTNKGLEIPLDLAKNLTTLENSEYFQSYGYTNKELSIHAVEIKLPFDRFVNFFIINNVPHETLVYNLMLERDSKFYLPNMIKFEIDFSKLNSSLVRKAFIDNISPSLVDKLPNVQIRKDDLAYIVVKTRALASLDDYAARNVVMSILSSGDKGLLAQLSLDPLAKRIIDQIKTTFDNKPA